MNCTKGSPLVIWFSKYNFGYLDDSGSQVPSLWGRQSPGIAEGWLWSLEALGELDSLERKNLYIRRNITKIDTGFWEGIASTKRLRTIALGLKRNLCSSIKHYKPSIESGINVLVSKSFPNGLCPSLCTFTSSFLPGRVVTQKATGRLTPLCQRWLFMARSVTLVPRACWPRARYPLPTVCFSRLCSR